MAHKIKIFGVLAFLFLSVGFIQSCKNKNPSVVKVYVRSASNDVVEGAKVIIIGDPSSNPPTNNYVDTVVTNDSGFAYFNVAPYFEEAGEDAEIAYFDVIAKTVTKQTSGYVRSRIHTTAVETVYFQ